MRSDERSADHLQANHKLLVTLIVCTRDRPKSLQNTLASLEKVRIPETCTWEVLLIDNASSDETAVGPEVFDGSKGIPVRWLRERRSGLSNARNRGVGAARGAILVYTDDDVVVTETWLQALISEFHANPDVYVVGGRTLPFAPGLSDQGLKLQLERREFRWPFSPGEVIGNNMAIRRDVFNRAGLFDPMLGAGRFFGAYEETDFIYRALKQGGKGVYTPDAVIYHNHDRITPAQTRRFQANYATGRGAFLMKHILRGDVFAMRMTYWWLDHVIREFGRAMWKEEWSRVGWAVRCFFWSATGALGWLVVEVWRLISRGRTDEVAAHQ